MNSNQHKKHMIIKHNKSKIIIRLFLAVCLSFFAGCGSRDIKLDDFSCNIVIEEGQGFTVENNTCSVKKGRDASFKINLEDGYQLAGAQYPDYSIQQADIGNSMTLTLKKVRYSELVSLDIKKSNLNINYFANGGIRLDNGSASEAVQVAVLPSHLRINTAKGTDIFSRKGYTLIGWNTASDGSGEHIGLGSRVEITNEMLLYAEWSKWSDSNDFSYEIDNNSVIITGYKGNEDKITVPAEINNMPVIAIEANGFLNVQCEIVVLPSSIRRLESYAFKNSALKEIYLYDNLSYVNDYTFEGCTELTTLHINAIELPVYSGSYYDTFQDKYDWLFSLKNHQKIVLFSGSSTRFGYDCEMLKEAFPDYEIVNMGVFAYTNAVPQLQLILDCMDDGDILIHAPEFDAAKRQFCTTQDVDSAIFSMMESDYDTFAKLDLRKFQKVFSSFNSYLNTKSNMTSSSYDLSASNFDENGTPVDEPSYNKYGDYILYRPNSTSVKPIYGLPVDYTIKAFPLEQYLTPLNQMYTSFLEKGIRVYFTYAPRNIYAISEDSTLEEREKLDQYFRQNLIVPVISNMEDSLYQGTYLYGTDNHLSTEGAKIRTEKIIEDLKKQLSLENPEVINENN